MKLTAPDKLAKPQPPEKPAAPVQVVTRMTQASRDDLKALADAEGITMQQLGVYAWSLALQAYGRPPLPEAADRPV
jgi:hypothetical protein